MSLKAYDGMMTTKGLAYVQEKIRENLPKFKEASEKKLAQSYAEAIINYTDGEVKSLDSYFYFRANGEHEVQEKLKTIKIEKDTTLLSYIFQAAKILSTGSYMNDFSAALYLTLEQKGKKLLIYPGLAVQEHKDILLTFLTDWYAQNQCDPDENVPTREWKQRCADWNGFNEVRGYTNRIILFDPTHHWNALVPNFRGVELFQAILKEIPSDEERKRSILRRRFLEERMVLSTKENNSDKYWEAHNYMRSDEGKAEFDKYYNDTHVDLVKIDETYLDEALYTPKEQPKKEQPEKKSKKVVS